MQSWTEIMSSLENSQAINRFENMLIFHFSGILMLSCNENDAILFGYSILQNDKY